MLERPRFMSEGSLNSRLELALLKFSVFELQDGKISLDDTAMASLVATVQATYNQMTKVNAELSCVPESMLTTPTTLASKCLYNNEQENPELRDIITWMGGVLWSVCESFGCSHSAQTD